MADLPIYHHCPNCASPRSRLRHATVMSATASAIWRRDEATSRVAPFRALPAMVATQALVNVQAEGDFAILNASHPMAEFFRLSTLQVRDRIVGSGAVSAAEFDAAIALFEDPEFWAFGPGGVAVRGQKPR